MTAREALSVHDLLRELEAWKRAAEAWELAYLVRTQKQVNEATAAAHVARCLDGARRKPHR